MNEAVWNYLRLESGTTAAKLWGTLERLRRLGCKYDDLPADRQSFLAALEALRREGRASKSGELWIAEFVAAKQPKGEVLLF